MESNREPLVFLYFTVLFIGTSSTIFMLDVALGFGGCGLMEPPPNYSQMLAFSRSRWRRSVGEPEAGL